MIIKQLRTRNFTSSSTTQLQNYLLNSEDTQRVAAVFSSFDVTDNYIISSLTDSIAQRIECRSSRAKARNCMLHCTISLSTHDRKLTTEQWRDVVNEFLHSTQLDDLPWYAVLHDDTEHQHVHVVASTIDIDTRKMRRVHRNAHELRRLAEELELKYELVRTGNNRKTQTVAAELNTDVHTNSEPQVHTNSEFVNTERLTLSSKLQNKALRDMLTRAASDTIICGTERTQARAAREAVKLQLHQLKFDDTKIDAAYRHMITSGSVLRSTEIMQFTPPAPAPAAIPAAASISAQTRAPATTHYRAAVFGVGASSNTRSETAAKLQKEELRQKQLLLQQEARTLLERFFARAAARVSAMIEAFIKKQTRKQKHAPDPLVQAFLAERAAESRKQQAQLLAGLTTPYPAPHPPGQPAVSQDTQKQPQHRPRRKL